MGAEQSANAIGRQGSNGKQRSGSDVTEADLVRMVEAQRLHIAVLEAQKNEARTAAAANAERERSPYQYNQNDLNVIGAQNTLYPNLGHQHSPSNVQNSYQTQGPQDYVFVNNCGPPARPPMPAEMPTAPPMPTAPRAPRDRSVSRNRNNKCETEFNCPTCHNRYGLVIYQCPNGHSACNVCKTTGRRCRLCGQYFTDTRNFGLEELISQRKVPCPNQREGCKLVIGLGDIESHVKECPFGEQKCPLAAIFGNCYWTGTLSNISKHFDSVHPAQRQTDVDTEMRLTNITNNSQQAHLVVIGVYNFLLHIKVSAHDKNIYMTAQLVGTKMSASKWTYEIHVYNKNENRRKYTFTDKCTSTNQSVNEIFANHACAVLPVAYANTFMNGGALNYKFYVKKGNEVQRDFGKNQRDELLETERGKMNRSKPPRRIRNAKKGMST